mgnify:CR=1 FL=1
MLTGTIVNVLAILVGSAVGLLIKWLGTRFSTLFAGATNTGLRLQAIITQGAALCVMYLGISGCLEGEHSLISILSMVLGCLIGELLDLDRRMRSLGDWVQEKTKRLVHEGGKATVAEGFVTASLLFCVGAMAIIGSIQDGISGSHDTLFAKAVLDMIIILMMTASLGKGCIFSAIPVAVFQGAVTLLAREAAPLFTEAALSNISLVGNVLIFCVGVNLVWPRTVRIANILPSIVIAAAFAAWA